MTTTVGALPIAEQFHSIQGEGQWVGTPMHFVRLAGCPVGRPASAVKLDKGPLPVLPTGATAMACATWDGRGFWCDTDYNTKYMSAAEFLIKETWEKHICLTGGEPLIHQKKLDRLRQLAFQQNIVVHIETSGTIELDDNMKSWQGNFLWITCAPKVACLDSMIKRADELKILVDATFHPDNLTSSMREHKNVFLCPVNDITEVKMENVERALMHLQQFPHWRLSCQLHKFLNLR